MQTCCGACFGCPENSPKLVAGYCAHRRRCRDASPALSVQSRSKRMAVLQSKCRERTCAACLVGPMCVFFWEMCVLYVWAESFRPNWTQEELRQLASGNCSTLPPSAPAQRMQASCRAVDARPRDTCASDFSWHANLAVDAFCPSRHLHRCLHVPAAALHPVILEESSTARPTTPAATSLLVSPKANPVDVEEHNTTIQHRVISTWLDAAL